MDLGASLPVKLFLFSRRLCQLKRAATLDKPPGSAGKALDPSATCGKLSVKADNSRE